RLLYFLLTPPPHPYIYTLSLHDALPILHRAASPWVDVVDVRDLPATEQQQRLAALWNESLMLRFDRNTPRPARMLVVRTRDDAGDRKSTRLNSSHRTISYAVFCLKKKI